MNTPIDDLRAMLDASPSPYHAVATVSQRLQAAGFDPVDPTEAFSDPPGRGFVVRDASVVAWNRPAGLAPHAPFCVVGAHTDSPGLRIKPHPQNTRYGWDQLEVELYGGALYNSWLNRDLGIAGIIVTTDGASALVDVDAPVAVVPQLAIHLDRGVNDGLSLNPQDHLRPVWATADESPDFAAWIAAQAGVDALPVSWNLSLYDLQAAAVIGVEGSLLASGRIDNLVSCWAATAALIEAKPVGHTAVVVLNDHEEVGSQSVTGAGGPQLEHTLERLVIAAGGTRESFLRALAASVVVSADSAHAIHPNYPERHDPGHAPLINRGPAIKINTNQRYATTPTTAQRFMRACTTADVEFQTFVSRNNMPCGTTIGPITAAQLGVDVVDVGIPQLSMHSARELCGVDDPPALVNALIALLSE